MMLAKVEEAVHRRRCTVETSRLLLFVLPTTKVGDRAVVYSKLPYAAAPPAVDLK